MLSEGMEAGEGGEEVEEGSHGELRGREGHLLGSKPGQSI